MALAKVLASLFLGVIALFLWMALNLLSIDAITESKDKRKIALGAGFIILQILIAVWILLY